MNRLKQILYMLLIALPLSSFATDVVISEFMAINNQTLADEFGDFPDWVELHNTATNDINLAGWHLTDQTNDLTLWTFPATNLSAGGFIVVFASKKTNAMVDLHTNFKLSGSGEYLALVQPDTNIADQFHPEYPQQVPDISYGRSMSSYLDLLAHWTFDDPTTTETLLADTSTDGTNNSGVFVSGSIPLGVGGVVAGAIELFGNQKIDFGNSSDFARRIWTASMWLYNDPGITGWRTAFGSWGNLTALQTFHIGRDTAGMWSDYGGGQTRGGIVQDATWTHLVSVRTLDGQENSLWINGVKQAQTSSGTPAPLSSENVFLGSKDGVHNAWDGRIDDLGYFDGTLTSSEIQAIGDLAQPPFQYSLAEVQQLINLHRAQNGSLTVGSDVWGFTNGLGNVEGLDTNGITRLVLDGALQTGLQLGLNGPPPDSTNALGYFATPTPNAINGIGRPLGPTICNASENLPVIPDNQNLVLTARVETTTHPFSIVTLNYRVMYGAESSVVMRDDGIGVDAVAGDSVYSAAIPHAQLNPGEMVRWSYFAEDNQSNTTRLPLSPNSTMSAEYFGTMVQDPAVTSRLPIIYWFIENPALAENVSGTRASVFYLDEFYDNVFVRRRGQTSSNWPKKSFKFEFNEDQHFRFAPDESRVDEFNLNTTYTDKAYIRSVLGFEYYRDAGSAACFSFPMRVEQNGGFYSVGLFIEQPDRDYLRRNGLDDDGALYKVTGNSIWGVESARKTATQGIDKKTRKYEDASDMQTLIDSMALSGTPLENYLFDAIDLPASISYMAASVLIQNIDRTVKNFYLYRDTEGNREWRFLPWDVDLSFGPNALNTDTIVATEDAGKGASHPFMGTSAHPYSGLWNGLLDAIVNTPKSQEMFLRRLRSLMDEHLATTYFEDRIDALLLDLSPDVLLDQSTWGDNAHFGTLDYTLQAATDQIKTLYLAPRRDHLFVTHTNIGTGLAGIPEPQSGQPAIHFGTFEKDPTSGNQNEEYIELVNSNSVAVDISGWRIDGGVEMVFDPGTVIPANDTLYLSPKVTAFRARATGPTGGQGLFVQGDYQGHLSNLGESLTLRGGNRVPVDTLIYTGTASTQQESLRITEVMYHPRTPEGISPFTSDDFEFVEIQNTGETAMNLNGVHFADGISFTFGNETLTPGTHVIIVHNLQAFSSRYSTNGLFIAGEFTGELNNNGEPLVLRDDKEQNISSFTYDDDRGWPLAAAGAGHALVPQVNAGLTGSLLDYGDNWRAGTFRDGSPGIADPPPFQHLVLNEISAHTDLSDTNFPTYDSNDAIELFNLTVTNISLTNWYLSDEVTLLKKWAITNAHILAASWLTFDEISGFHNPTNSGFGLNKAGEQVLLSYLPGTDQDRVADALRFEGQENGKTLGRYPDGTAYWLTTVPTLNSTNALEAQGPILSELMYHPLPTLQHPEDNVHDEYIALHNPSGHPIALWNNSGTFRIAGEIDFTFPSNLTIQAGSHLLVVSFDPTDTNSTHSFYATYGLNSGDVPLLGPYNGKLSNRGGRVALERPQAPDAIGETTSWVIVDEVIYFDHASWPITADVAGLSLHRIDPAVSGLDPNNWTAGQPSPSNSIIDTPKPNPEIMEVQPGMFGIAWNPLPNVVYTIEYTDSLANQNWMVLGTVKTNGLATWIDPILPGDPRKFYRVTRPE